MNVGELKEMLKNYPDDMEILNERYDIVMLDDWSVVKAVPKGNHVMRSYSSMSEENKAKEKDYLFIYGN